MVDLGDGLVAEVTLQPDAASEAQTRSTVMPDDHYTIYALNSSGQRISTISGTLSGGKFTLDASSRRMSIGAGTYTFVCFNDAVSLNAAGGLSVPTLSQNPMIGKATETISGGDWQVMFAMKHQAARVRLKITSYTAEGVDVKGTIGWTTPQPSADAYHLDATADAANSTTGVNTSEDYAFAASNAPYDSIVKPHYQVSDYQYVLPGTQTNDLTVRLTGGTLHGKALAGKEIPLSKNATALLRNESYTLNVTLRTKDPLYLYQDGTVGYWGDDGIIFGRDTFVTICTGYARAFVFF